MKMISIKNANKTYNKGSSNALDVIKNCNLDLPNNGMIAIFGPSGCGKTTLLNVIGGLDKLDSGQITIDDNVVSPKNDAVRNEYIGYIFQNYNLNIHKTVYENVSDALYLCGLTDEMEIDRRVMSALKSVEMEYFIKRTPDTLSGGQQQRVAIARAIVKGAHIILADEPTGNLDEINTIMVMDLLSEIAKDHLVIIVTHEVDIALKYCHKIIEINDGKIVSVKDNDALNNNINDNILNDITKNKNHIYLGDLDKKSEIVNNIKINFYGDNFNDLELTIVNYEGKYYLQTNSQNIKYLSDDHEVKLKEGSFKEEIIYNPKKLNIDMSELKHLKGSNYGKLFSFKKALKESIKSNFSKKKSEKLLMRTLFILGVVLVFSIAVSSVGLGKLFNLKKNIPDDLIYIPINNNDNFSFINDNIGNFGIDNIQVVTRSSIFGQEYFSIKLGNYVSANVANVYSECKTYDDQRLDDMKLLVGKKKIEKGEVVISSELADEIIASSTVNYINDYKDLLYLDFTYNGEYKVVGIVESLEKALFRSREDILDFIYSYKTISYADNILSNNLNDDEIIIFGINTSLIQIDLNQFNSYSPSEKITYLDSLKGQFVDINGITFKIKQIYTNEMIDISYLSGNKYNYNGYLEYRNKYLSEDEFVTKSRYLLEEVSDINLIKKYYYINQILNLSSDSATIYNIINNIDDQKMINYIFFNDQQILLDLSFSINNLMLAMEYYEEYSKYPTLEEAHNYSIINENNVTKFEQIKNKYEKEYQKLYEEYSIYNMNSNIKSIITHDAALKTISNYGRSTSGFRIYDSSRNYIENTFDANYYLLVQSNNLDETIKFLDDNLQNNNSSLDKFITPSRSLQMQKEELLIDFISSSITVVIIIIVMGLSVFAIMRSRFMTKVKEVGIYRVIGVSKKNLLFRYLVETMVIITFTTVIAYFISSIIIWSLSGKALFSTLFYFPVWLAIATLVIIYSISLLFGILPAMLLLRKTPSEILSKYDI